MTRPANTFETRIADLVRRFGTEFEGEALATWRALKRLLAAHEVNFTDLGDAVEKLATGGLEKAALERVFAAGEAEGLREAERRHAEAQAAYGLNADGSCNWESIALHCQRQNAELKSEWEREFINSVAARATRGSPLTGKQEKHLLVIFRQLGGRL